jgi:hypothetical protein
MRTLMIGAIATLLVASPATADDLGAWTSMLWFHNNCQSVFYPPELRQIKSKIDNATPAEVRTGQRLVENGIRMWGEDKYCGLLTAVIKEQLPEIATRLQ